MEGLVEIRTVALRSLILALVVGLSEGARNHISNHSLSTILLTGEVVIALLAFALLFKSLLRYFRSHYMS